MSAQISKRATRRNRQIRTDSGSAVTDRAGGQANESIQNSDRMPVGSHARGGRLFLGASCTGVPAGRCRRSIARVRLEDDLLADGGAVSAREGGRRCDGGWLLLRGQQFLLGRARRHAHRRAGPFCQRASKRGSDPAGSTDGRGARDRRGGSLGGRPRLPGRRRGLPALGTRTWGDWIGRGGADSHRLLAPVAGCGAVPRHSRTRPRRGGEAAFSRVAPGRCALADREGLDQGRRHRYREHRLRSVEDVRVAPAVVRA